MPARPSYPHARPAPRNAAGPPRLLHADITWTRSLGGPGEPPRERYRILYLGSDGAQTEREIELLKVGHFGQQGYLGVNDLSDAGRFKTLRTDRVTTVTQLTEGHPPSLAAAPTYRTRLPEFPLANAVFRIPQTASRNAARTWSVDLNLYTCTCPEKRIRTAAGYTPGELGFVCDHMARAILDQLPPVTEGTNGWTPELLAFLRNPRKVAVDNLAHAAPASSGSTR